MFPYLRISSLFWRVFCFNESEKETLNEKSPRLLAGWMTLMFWEAGRRAHAVTPVLDHAHTYRESTVRPPAHTQSRLKVLDLLYTHRSTAIHRDRCTHVLPVYQHLRISWEGRSWRLQPLEQIMSIWIGSMMNCSSSSSLIHSWLSTFLGKLLFF